MMRRAAILALALLAPAVQAAGGNDTLPGYSISVDLTNRPSLQRGAKYFVNYCLSCHSLAYSRYSRVGSDLGLTEEMVQDNLIFTGRRVGETMEVAMDPIDAEAWFGAVPPDLSTLARQKGAEYIYQFLMTFYRDESRPWGVSNWRFPNTSMPHVLWQEQGLQEPIRKVPEYGGPAKITGLRLAEPGHKSPEEYRQMAVDITTFLVYVAEPARLTRESMGVWVLGFLLLLIGLTFALKREYWKDVH